MNSLRVRGWPEMQKVPGQDTARGQNGQLQGRPCLETEMLSEKTEKFFIETPKESQLGNKGRTSEIRDLHEE